MFQKSGKLAIVAAIVSGSVLAGPLASASAYDQISQPSGTASVVGSQGSSLEEAGMTAGQYKDAIRQLKEQGSESKDGYVLVSLGEGSKLAIPESPLAFSKHDGPMGMRAGRDGLHPYLDLTLQDQRAIIKGKKAAFSALLCAYAAPLCPMVGVIWAYVGEYVAETNCPADKPIMRAYFTYKRWYCHT